MIYPELFRQLEAVRWNMDHDIPWASFDAAKLSDEQAQTVKMNAITEWADHQAPTRGTDRDNSRAAKALFNPGFKNDALRLMMAETRRGDEHLVSLAAMNR